MADATLPSPDLLRQLLRYDAERGLLFWKPRPLDLFTTWRACCVWNSRYAGEEALAGTSTGYKTGSIFNRPTKAHRVIWVLEHGYWPKVIDHIDGNALNNRIGNLRDVPQRINCKNCKLGKNNTSGVTGVHWRRDTGRWSAKAMVNRKEINLGCFASLEEATAARKAADARYGFHPNHGRKA